MNNRIFKFIVFLIIFFLMFSYMMDRNKANYIKLDNKTKMDLKDLTLISGSFKQGIRIPILKSGDFQELQLDLEDSTNQVSIDLSYLNNIGDQVKEPLVNGFKTNKKIQKRFTILDIDDKGNLKIEENKYGITY